MYNVILTNGNKVEYNYVFFKKVKAEAFFKLCILEYNSNANIGKALDEGVYSNIILDDTHHKVIVTGKPKKTDIKSWVLSISEAKKGSRL